MEKPSPEAREVIKKFCDLQRQKYGPDWKRILARKMAEASMPYVRAILNSGKRHAPD